MTSRPPKQEEGIWPRDWTTDPLLKNPRELWTESIIDKAIYKMQRQVEHERAINSICIKVIIFLMTMQALTLFLIDW